jgi:hypothetical protein
MDTSVSGEYAAPVLSLYRSGDGGMDGCSSETLVFTYSTALCRSTEVHNLKVRSIAINN